MKKNNGFSLLETLLYLGIFAIVGGSLFGILTNVVRISTREISGDEVASQLQFAMETVTRLVRESSAIENATTTATTTLKLRMTISAQDPTCITLVNGILKMAQGPDQYQQQDCTATTTDLTTSKVIVDNALFKRIATPGGHDQVAIDMQFSNTATGVNKISRALRTGVARVSAATFDADLLPNTDAQYEVGFSTKRWKNINVSGLLNLGAASGAPSGAQNGSLYYDTSSNTFKGYANGAWGEVGGGNELSGVIKAWAGTTSPAGYLEANGAAVSRVTYASLFAVLGTRFGVGDGSTTFNLPDLRGEFIRGWDNARGVDSGRLIGSSQSSAVGPHDHRVDVNRNLLYAGGGGRANDAPGVDDVYQGTGGKDRTSDPITGGASETRPRNIALMYIIKI